MKSFPAILHRFSRLFTIALFLLAVMLPARAVNLVQEFYLPMPEAQINQANNAIIAGTSSTINSIFSIVVTGTGTVIYYDQWEDGYEVNLASPTQSTTQIWGDGNTNNGVAPGYPTDILPVGGVITLTNAVPQPRNPSVILWDARDRVAANKALVISRAAWPVTPGPVFGGAVGVLSTIDYGTNFISPVGQNLTNNLFKYVGMFIMAAQNNTAVTIDPNGNGVGTTSVVLNQGESYLVNGGVLKGGRVTATKLIQADLIIGHVGASYAADWFTLYPVESWSSSYYTPVGSAASVNQPAYVYLYNPGTNAITVNCTTKVGSIPVSVPGTNGVYQFQMPVGSGANFASAGGQNFYTLETVAANNGADTAYNWGFTLVPKAGLTTEATVGWGPGSADGTVNGSPVWITALANTTLYVDYKGDHAGPLAYTNGSSIQNYDTNFTVMTALQSLKIFDPSKNQTGMRVFTIDGTLVAGAWGEDPDTAQPGNPYIDAGTTVIPFPTPLLFKSVTNNTSTNGLKLNDTLTYTVQVNNQGLLPLGNTVIIDSPTTNLTYVTNSTTYNGSSIPDNPGPYNATNTAFPLDAYGSAGYTIPIILSQGVSTFTYQAKVNAAGAVSNSVNIGGTTITTQTYLAPPPTNGAPLAVNFSDTNGVATNVYTAGANVFVTMTNGVGNTSSNTVQTINVTVIDTNTGDLQTITLTETSTNSGVFRNIVGLPTSTSSGLAQQDGTLYIAPGDTLSVSYTDPTYGTSASATAQILVPAPNKQLYLTANGVTNNQFLNRINPVATANHGTTYTSVDIGSGGGGAITQTATNIFSNGGAATITIPNVTVSAAANGLLLVAVACDPSSANTVSTMKYGAQNMALVGRWRDAGGTGNQTLSELWSLAGPTTGTTNVVITFTAAQGNTIAVASVFAGVNQSTPFSRTNNADGSGTSITNIITSAAGEQVFSFFTSRSGTAATASGAGQVKIWGNVQANTYSAGSLSPGAASVTTLWTNVTGGAAWSSIAVSIKPAAGGGGGPATNTTSFVQTPSFALPFTMPAGGAVSITNFITITNGAAALAASPNLITATLRTNGVNFLTLTNTTLVGNTNLIWTGILPATVTLPTNAVITYVISNNVANSAFHVNYDSTNSPSQIVLPASTIISITTNGVYDAPYPGGNLINSPVAGSTIYLRTAVSDPFGYYDITSLGLVVTGPVGFSTNLTDVNVVYTNGAVKIYEYAVTTGPNTGTYNLAVTANEGTEGVKVSTATSITTTFLDLGTPSATSFTAGPNGVDTNNYAANGLVSVRVSDLNRNTNAATVDTVSVTITNSAGDFETLTLIETGTNTGIFTNSINASTNIVNLPTNGTLYAPVGSILTVNYTDPTDTSDSTSATATIQPLPGVPGVVMNKTIVSPSGGQVGVSNNITFNLQAVNVGSTTLPNLSLSDTFPAAKLSFVSASLTPSTTNAGVLTWTNLGAFTPGQSTNITVTFLTLATGATTNFATANGGTATNTTFVPFAINRTALSVTKTLLSPTNTPVAVGSNVVFRITVQNTGNVTVDYLPMEDSFSAAYYQFVSSTITNNGSGAGSLIWTNLASPTALVAGATITNDVTMKVVGQGSPANNTATVDYATDINGNPVPTTTSTIGVNTASAAINGHVYNDINQSGVFTNGDTGLANVTLQLYTDPTGTGTPGTLVQITTTDGNGYYELLNLGIGKYVVVETDLPGYASSSPANNRLSLNLTNLTAFTNANFFDYIPAPSVYSTISGSVWYDTNGNGTNNVGETNLANIAIDLVQDVNSNGVANVGEPVVASTITVGTNGTYTLSGITPGRYVIQQTLPYGYYSSGNSQGRTDSQLVFVSTNGVVTTNNSFYDRLSPIAVNDTTSALYFVSTNISPLTNDISPNGDPLTITNASSTNGFVVINPGSTNLTFTPTNLGVTTITYTVADAHGGTSTATITVNVTELANLAIGKTASTTVFATSNLTYTISVTNLGPTPASLVVVTDTLPVGVTFVSASGGGVTNAGLVTWSLGTLTNNQTSNLTVTVTAPVSGSLTNTANISSPTPDPTPTNNVTPPVITSVTPVANVGLGKTALASVLATSNLSYTISVTNFGPSSASSVTVTDTLPAGVTYVSASGGGVTNAGLVTWSLGTLTNSQTTNLTLIVTAPTSGSLTNVASVNTPTGDPVPTNNVTPPVVTGVTPVTDIIVLNVGPGSVVAGTTYTNTISVTNAGPSVATNVVVVDTLPNGVTVTNSYPTLAAGSGTNFTVTYTAPGSGSLTNVATGSSGTFDPNLGNNTNIVAVTAVIGSADVVIAKTAATTVLATSNLSYTISVTNFGPSSASSVTVTDTLPAGVTYVSASGGGVTNAGLVTWSLGTLTNSQTTNLTLIVTAPTSGSLTNVASVNTPTGDPVPTNNVTPPVVTGVTPVVDLAVSKTGPAAVGFGFSYDYTISVTNFGPSIATGIAVTDSLPAGLVFVSSIPVATTNASNQVIWTNLGNLVSGATTNLTLTVNSIVHGNVTNLVSGGTPFFDPTPTNNIGVPVVTTITNIAPVAINQNVTMPEDTSTNLVVHGTDVDSTNLTYAILSGPTNGVLGTLNTNTGAVTYTPNTNYNGGDSFTFTVFDGSLYATGTVTLTVTPVNDAPVANDQSVSTPQNTAKPITLTGSDVENSPLTFIIVTSPAHGTLTLLNTNTGAVTYTPSNNYVGPDSFTFRVNDGQTNSAVATVSINVSATSGADVQVTLFGPALATVGDVFSFTNSVTNAGPATAVNTRVTNALPANLTFASASGGGIYSNGVVTWPVFPSLASGQATNLIVSVKTTTSGSTITPTANPLNFLLTNAPPTVSSATNRASAFATTFDPNLTNNIASAFYTNAQAQTLIVPGAFSVVLVTNTYPTNAVPTNTIIPIGTGLFIVGTSAFNPQTQLYEEFVTVTNIGLAPVHALRLSIGGLPSRVKLYNATGTNNGVPYVEYDPPYNSPLNPYPQANSSVTFTLEFFVSDRRPFTNSLTAVAINAPPPSNVTGTTVQIIQYGFNDQRNPGSPRYLVQFTSIPGRTYTVQYSDDDMATWNNATPSILASATSTFWYDDGPPVTVSPPAYPNSSRFYRVLLNP
jgi:uncharacterized repeat protein (TIGR01451 family)